MITSLFEEAGAIGWYEQRIWAEKDGEARAIMENAQEEFKHFGMDQEFLPRRTPKWRAALRPIPFQDGNIVDLGREGEEGGGEAVGIGYLLPLQGA